MDDEQLITMKLEMDCSVCEAPEVWFTSIVVDIPYFGETTEASMTCKACGHRSSEYIFHGEGEPTRFSIRIENEQHLQARVVRSYSGTIIIPELDLVMEPRGAAQAFVSNAEGILVRFQTAVETLKRTLEGADLAQAESIENDLARCREGNHLLTIVVEDPHGRSMIIHDDVEVESLTKEDLERLHTPDEMIMSQDEVSGE